MSTSTPTTVGTSAGTLTTAGSTSPLQITGLASGLNTNAIISAELAEAELPITNMQSQVAGLQTVDNTLTSFQSMLQTVQLDAQALGDPSLFQPTQAITSSDSSLVCAVRQPAWRGDRRIGCRREPARERRAAYVWLRLADLG